MKITLLTATVFFVVAACLESRIHIGESFWLQPDQQIREELVLLSETVKLQGNLTKELLVAARELEILGEVGEDIVAAAQTVTFRGKCQGDFYLLSDSSFLHGAVRGNATILTREVNADQIQVERNLRVVAEQIFWSGKSKGKAVFWGKKVVLGGQYEDLIVSGQNVHFLPGTTVRGNLTYHAREPLILPSEVQVQGRVVWQEPVASRWKTRLDRSPFKQLLWLGRRGFNFFGLLLPFFLSVWLTPRLLSETTSLIGNKPWSCLLTGFLGLLGIILLIVISVVTIIAAPLALISASFLVPVFYLARGFPALFLGRKILFRFPETRTTWLLTVFVGVSLLTAITWIPRVGLIVNLACLLLGSGAFISGRWQMFCRLRQEGLI
ncbi:MAG TPA: hypothetical protein PKX93_01765 [bacterium]|nr:hypothetical protein [bacterium]HOL66169.1 hypothetical protein [bacterium]HPP12300.1 hypothetical protein [bacterium]